MVNGSDLVGYLTGDGTHLGSNGGPITVSKIISKQLNNGFTDLDYVSSQAVVDHYMCIAAKNDNNADEHVKNFTAYIEFQPTNEFQTIALGKGTANKNTEEQTIADRTTPPSGVTWRLNPSNFASGILLGEDFAAGDWQTFWVWRRNRPNTKATKGTKFRLVLAADPPAGAGSGGSGSGGGSSGGGGGTTTPPPTGGGGTTTPPPPPPTGGSGGIDPPTGGGGTTTPPPPPAISDTKIGLAGDFSCNSDGAKTIENLILENCNFYVLQGDYSYADTAGCFTSRATAIKTKTYITFGNHEREEGTPQPALTNAFLNFFGHTKTWYGVVINGVLIVVMDLYSAHGVGSQQYNDIKNILETNKNNININWRIMSTHEPWFTAPTSHRPEDNQRRIYWKMMQDNKVDIIMHGHVHNYQRTFPALIGSTNDSIIISNPQNSPNWTRQPGDLDEGEIFFVINGDGGRTRHSLTVGQQHGWIAKHSGSIFGYSIIEITENSQKLTFKHYRNDRTLFDIFSIRK